MIVAEEAFSIALRIQHYEYRYESGTLHVQFHSGGLYAYFDVPESVYVELMAAASHGKYLHSHIKGRYQYARLR